QIKESIKNFQEIHNQVRHDIRGPLQAINNAAHILSTDPNNQKMRTILAEQVNYVKTILEDWETQSLNGNLKKTQVNIKELVQTAVKTIVRGKAETSLDIDKALVWEIDYNRFLRAISNILQNSVEALPEKGTIKINCYKAEENLIIKISDTGVGIPEENLSQIGQPFYTTKQKGTGLGLSFVRQVVESHNGTFNISSKTDNGTTVTIRIPKQESS
ncbi:MAG: HAMP domain-containing histidine kinase, partial [Candidatus Bathyarchaeota archaeon]|nr:HAMP domain-containing histidine kinase [Candidatus Bathyarchaeota archaeon]